MQCGGERQDAKPEGVALELRVPLPVGGKEATPISRCIRLRLHFFCTKKAAAVAVAVAVLLRSSVHQRERTYDLLPTTCCTTNTNKTDTNTNTNPKTQFNTSTKYEEYSQPHDYYVNHYYYYCYDHYYYDYYDHYHYHDHKSIC